ncbi:MAG: GntR family transcriptional regulator [Bacteroidales bacterium]|nr:GntR family transcriptional regulator [Bacteroidales bacterium]
MEFKKQKSIFHQIADTLCQRILDGEWPECERFPSIREVAGEMGVNPNTVMRSYDSLQNLEIIFNRRGVGYFVADNAKEKILDMQRREFLEEELPAIAAKIKMLGLDPKTLFD